MARERTLLQMRTEVRQRADVENATLTHTDAEVNNYINQSISALYDLILSHSDQEPFVEAFDITVTNNDSYTLPTDFYEIRAVDRQFSATSGMPLRPYNNHDRHRGRDARFYGRFFISGREEVRWRVGKSLSAAVNKGDGIWNISFRPQDIAFEATVWYIPHAPVLTADTDVWDGFNGWEEYVTVDAAMKILEKEGRDTTAFQVRKNDLVERIKVMADAINIMMGESIADVEGQWP